MCLNTRRDKELHYPRQTSKKVKEGCVLLGGPDIDGCIAQKNCDTF
jgi:hypothetical protein